MPTNKFQLEQIASFNNQATVDVNSAQDWVDIKDINDPEISVFLQGDDAFQFISRAKEMYESNGDIALEDCYAFFAYDYLELLVEE